jgi:Tol biopolymer transport system component
MNLCVFWIKQTGTIERTGSIRNAYKRPESRRPVRTDDPAWSPDGRSIAFVRTKGDKLDVLLISPFGGPERKVAEITAGTTTGIFSWAGPYLSWSPDSKYLVMMDRLSAGEP